MAGGGLRRFDLLEGAVNVVSDLMRDTDAMGLVYFDHNVIRRMNMTAMTAAGGKTQVATALADPALEPAGGSTAIGSAMIEAADVITDEMNAAGTPYSRFAMLVMTDGNENVLPYADDPPVTSVIAPFSNEVYAVGLGREGEVSDATLGAIANYMLITGDMDASEREFRLTKYFVQILAGITNMAIVTDPSGDLTFGVKHRVEFHLTKADLEADIITLSPFAFLIDMTLETPDGTVLTPSDPGPNGSFQRNIKDIFYRLGLPAIPESAKISETSSSRVKLAASNLAAYGQKVSRASRLPLRRCSFRSGGAAKTRSRESSRSRSPRSVAQLCKMSQFLSTGPPAIAISQYASTSAPADSASPVIRWRIDRALVICSRWTCKCGDKGRSTLSVMLLPS